MIIFGAFFVNIIVTFIFFKLNPKEYKWYEFIISIVVTTALIFGAKALVNYASVTYTEYWGETIVGVYEEEPYNYWHHETCSESYACGTDSDGNTTYCTRYYDCSRQIDVGPEWYSKTNLGNSYRMSERHHDKLVKLFGTQKKSVSSRENHDAGDACYYSSGTKFQGKRVGRISHIYKTEWPGTEVARKGVFTEHSYKNRIKASDLSLFNISVVTEKEADSLGLFEYPDDIDVYTCPVFFGGDISEKSQELFRRLNAKFGPTNQLRLWILVFENKPHITATYQENYWVKGNKNELVVCIGINDNKEIEWSHAFSWSKSNSLTSEASSKVLDMYEYTIQTENMNLPVAIPLVTNLKETISDVTGIDTTMLPPVLPLGNILERDITKVTKSKTPILNDRTLEEYYKYFDANLQRFERREFEEFSYVKVDPKWWHTLIVYLIALIVSIILNIIFTNNQLKD